MNPHDYRRALVAIRESLAFRGYDLRADESAIYVMRDGEVLSSTPRNGWLLDDMTKAATPYLGAGTGGEA